MKVAPNCPKCNGYHIVSRGTCWFCKDCGKYFIKERKPKVKKTCPCGTKFIPNVHNQKYCSGNCTLKPYNRTPKPLLKKKCPQCGIEFETKNPLKKYCDSSCTNKFNRKKQRLGFPTKPYVKKNPRKVHCFVCGEENIIDCSTKDVGIFYCMKCLKRHAGKSVRLEGIKATIEVPKIRGI